MKRRFPSLLATALAGLACFGPAQAVETYPGCATPPARSPTAHVFYVDPQRGDKANDGSKQHPWRTLEEVVDPRNRLLSTKSYVGGALTQVNPNGPIKPGDTIYLLGGSHGAILVRQAFNDEFISVLAAPGQKPLLASLQVAESSHWLFRGLAIRSPIPAGQPTAALVDIRSGGWPAPTDNVVFVDNEVATVENSDAWSGPDWVHTARHFGLVAEGSCVTLSANHFYNLRNAMLIGGEKQLIEGNLIERFGNDGIDMHASNILIRRNIIRDGRHTDFEELHPDGIQGWSVDDAVNRNVVLDSNTLIKTGDRVRSMMQGISLFSGRWDGLRVINNVVITNAWHGVALFGVKNALVANNTVLPSDTAPTWIVVQEAKDNRPSVDVVVRNNIAGQILVTAQGATVDHNIATSLITLNIDGRKVSTKSGAIDTNRVSPSLLSTFVRFDPILGEFDLRLGPQSPAIGAGAAASAPQKDINGKARRSPVDIGAYVH